MAIFKRYKWVLVLDYLGKKIISSCMKMHEIIDNGVTIVENLERHRQPIQMLEAVYILTPDEMSIQRIVADFEEGRPLRYKVAHIFFTEVCPDHLLAPLRMIRPYVKTLKEIDIAFVPREKQVFSLDCPWAFKKFYSTTVRNADRIDNMEKMAEQLATLCASLGEYPSVRYRHESSRLGEFARFLKDKLDIYKLDDPAMGEGSPQKSKSQLLLLDRGFDPVSPLLHELTYQAMAYDLLDIQNDVFKYQCSTESQAEDYKEAILDVSEDDEFWVKLRHLHIADVTRKVPEEIKTFSDQERLPVSDDKLKDLQSLLKKAPEYQRQVRKFLAHFTIAENCMNLYKEIVEKLCRVEQDLATGEDKEGEPLKEPVVRHIMPILLDPKVSTNNRVRVILLYILLRNGISEENFNKLCEHAEITTADRTAILNMVHLGIPITLETCSRKVRVKRKQRTETFYLTSRWVPYVKDLIEDVTEGRLSDRLYPYLIKRSIDLSAPSPVVSARRATPAKLEKASTETRDVPRLVVFIMGGVSYSETRAAYEVAASNSEWEILIGMILSWTFAITPGSSHCLYLSTRPIYPVHHSTLPST
ncbi:syntaxin-binding protein 1-like [Actinia tenebrosa]|uniref:Syntaxin-binding protein 1-like n=1 Tax=Actinia tenebrosa TaxID=6105 RepID=A0A6P8IRD1_ACTTE|nr:syntaxin-binding protein 1-like [Actinia tenebrosa]